MAPAFIRFVATVVLQVAHELFRHAVAIGARVVRAGVARLHLLCAEGDVVLVGAVLAVGGVALFFL